MTVVQTPSTMFPSKQARQCVMFEQVKQFGMASLHRTHVLLSADIAAIAEH